MNLKFSENQLVNSKDKKSQNGSKHKSKSYSLKTTGKYKNISLKKIFYNKIWIIKISRPEVANAIDFETSNELNNVFKDFNIDKNSLVAILSGKGKSFCSGADLRNISLEIDLLKKNNFIKDENTKSKMNEISESNDGPLGISRLMLDKPVIAAINGAAVAGGFELILWCDLRVTYRNCEMGIYCRKRGVPLIDGGTYRLQKLIGLSKAMDLILTGRKIDGNEGYSCGLINRIVDDKKNVMKEAKKLAIEICSKPQDCMRNDRQSLLENTYNGKNLNQKIQTEFQLGLKSLNSNELKDAVNEYLKKKTNKKMLPKF